MGDEGMGSPLLWVCEKHLSVTASEKDAARLALSRIKPSGFSEKKLFYFSLHLLPRIPINFPTSPLSIHIKAQGTILTEGPE